MLTHEQLTKIYQTVLERMALLQETEIKDFIRELHGVVSSGGREGSFDNVLDGYLPGLKDTILSQVSSIEDKHELINSLGFLFIALKAEQTNFGVASSASRTTTYRSYNWWSGPAWSPYGYYGGNTYIFVGGGSYRQGGGHHHGHHGADGDFIKVLIDAGAIGFAITVFVALVIGAAAITAVVTKEAYSNFKEIFTELAHNQRVAANMATLVLTAAAVAGVVALLASNPVGWGAGGLIIATVTFYWLCTAVLVMSRYLNNQMDASIQHATHPSNPSALAGDSRFVLTPSEEKKITLALSKQEVPPNAIASTIVQIKVSLSALAKEVKENKVDSTRVAAQLVKLKQGDLSGSTAVSSTAYKLKFQSVSAEELKQVDASHLSKK